MTVSVTGQALSLGAGILLGIEIGLCYDLFRILRCRIPRAGLTHFLDLLFWFGVTVLLFVYAYRAEGGRVRIYLALTLLGGGGLYFRLFSRIVLRLGYRFVDLIQRILRFFLAPLVFAGKKLKKFLKKLKNIFLSRLQWYKIISRLGVICRYRRRSPGSE